jgi:predicted aldo/keto reductase-like oxidoreductase
MKGGSVDYEEFCRMADAFIEAGFNYFDTAHAYLGGLSETAIRDCVAKRWPREKFLLANKLTTPYFNKQEDIRPFVESQLKLCGVDYFDFYLMHAQDRNNYQKYKRCQAYETCNALKQEGLIRHFGISFHDKADVLDMILTEHPEIEIVQIQFNYADYEDASVESRKVYEVCEKHGKPCTVLYDMSSPCCDINSTDVFSNAVHFFCDDPYFFGEINAIDISWYCQYPFTFNL